MRDMGQTVKAWELYGLRPGASPQEIEQRYRELAKQAHPDAGGSVEAFQLVQDARLSLLAVTLTGDAVVGSEDEQAAAWAEQTSEPGPVLREKAERAAWWWVSRPRWWRAPAVLAAGTLVTALICWWLRTTGQADWGLTLTIASWPVMGTLYLAFTELRRPKRQRFYTFVARVPGMEDPEGQMRYWAAIRQAEQSASQQA